jgi:hypothetical protein
MAQANPTSGVTSPHNVPPQNIEAEESVLGAMLVTGDAWLAVEATGLDANDFYLDRHRAIFAAVADLASRDKPHDEIAVGAALEDADGLAEIGGRDRLAALAATCPAVGNAKHHAEIVQKNALLRRLLGIGQEIAESVRSRNGSEPAELHRRAVEALSALAPTAHEGDWLASAAALLSNPDPGPTPFLVERLLVEGAIGALVGSYKRGKTWLLIDIAISVASGREMFGELAVAQGPVLLIVEESGEAALHRRLTMLARGRAIPTDELADLFYAANRRIRLDDPAWRGRLIATAERIRPRLILLDPLVRLKGGADENSQAEMAPVLDFIRDLRDAGESAVLFSQHTGHGDKARMRGTADLEGYWESKLTLTAEEGSPVAELRADHREAESGGVLKYRRVFDEDTDSLRLNLIESTESGDAALDELLSAVRFKPGRSTTELAKAVGKRRSDTASRLKNLETDGTAYRAPSQITDGAGRARKIEGWFLTEQSQSQAVPFDGTGQDDVAGEGPGRPTVPPFIGGTGDHVASASAGEGSS